MKRLSVVLIVALVAGLLGGCRFAIVESDAIQVMGLAALAEDEGEALFDLQEEGDAAPVEVEATPAPEESSGLIGLHSRDEEGESGVRKLQEALIRLGYLKVEADGAFGSRTLKALKHFQSDNGLEQTGVLDAATQAALFPEPEVTTAPGDLRYSVGSSGEGVRKLREKLRQYGFSTREALEEFDEMTADEVMAFQTYAVERYGTEFDDPIDPALMLVESSLVESGGPEQTALAALPEATPEPAPLETALPEMPALAPVATLRPHHAMDGMVSENLYAYLLSERFPVYRSTVQRGDEGIEVQRVQSRLSTLDYYYEEVTGAFDEATVEALRLFQESNRLQATGIADAETQTLLFSKHPVAPEKVDQPFYIKVSLVEQRVYVYRWVDGDYSRLIKTMVCSTGFGNSTPKGIFVSPGRRDARWHYFAEFNCWAQYAFIIKGSILFHSVIFSGRSEATLRRSTLYNLGRKASHGCVRLKVEDAKWIYDHCGAGQVIEIY